MRVNTKYLLLVFLVFGSFKITRPQNISFTRIPPPATYPYSLISGMSQDSLGYLWFTSGPGLYRYDGYNFKTYLNNPNDSQSLSGQSMECVYVDKTGLVWVGDIFSGLSALDPVTGKVKRYRHIAGDPTTILENHISSINEDNEGNIWIGTSKGLNVLNKATGEITSYKHDPGDPGSISCDDVITIYKDRSGTMWVGTGGAFLDYGIAKTRGGLNKFDRATGKFIRYVHQPGNKESISNDLVQTIFEDSHGTFWVGTCGKDGLHTMDRTAGKFTQHRFDPANPSTPSRPPLRNVVPYAQDHVTFIEEDITGAIWIGTFSAGLSRYDPKTHITTRYTAKNDPDSLHETGVWSIYKTRDGMMWMGSWDMGKFNFYKIDPQPGTIPQYLFNYPVFNYLEDPSGALYIGGYGFHILNRDKKLVKSFFNDIRYEYTDSLSSNYVLAMIKDRSGKIWLGTAGGGLNVFDPVTEKFEKFQYYHNTSNSNRADSTDVTALLEDSHGSFWIGTSDGLHIVNKEKKISKHIRHDKANAASIGGNYITSILEDNSGIVWIGAENGGLNKFNRENGTFTRYLNKLSVHAIYQDAQHVLWVGTSDGLYSLDKNSNNFVRYSDYNFQHEPIRVLGFIEDDDRNLWLTTFSGLYVINQERKESRFYTVTENWSIGREPYLPAYKLRSGELLFGNPRGFYDFFPREFLKKTTRPEIVLSSFSLSDKDGKNVEAVSDPNRNADILLRYNQNTFSLEFVGINFKSPSENRHLYKLEPYQSAWQKSGSEHVASFYNVPPGDYTLRLSASNSNGAWSERSIRITITPPWWSTWWFITFVVLVGLGILYGVIRWRVHHMYRIRLERTEKEKQLADLKHKTSESEIHTLRAQMNPHFIFNSLNSINRFILQNNRAQASEYLTKFSKLVRLVFQNSQSATVTLDSELEALQLYLELESLRFDNHFEFSISVSGELDTAALKVPPLIIQPYAENAIWHGLMHKKEKGKLEIDIYDERDVLICRIKDDGIGRKKVEELRGRTLSTHKSMGMRITADRILLLQQQNMIQEAIRINDLVLPDGSPGGTEVILKMPLRYD